jgi:hypothetical protein
MHPEGQCQMALTSPGFDSSNGVPDENRARFRRRT